MITIPTLKSDLEVMQLVTSVVASQKLLRENLQEAIVQCILSARSTGNGNLNPLSFLVNGLLQNGKRKHFKEIEEYIKAFTPIKFKQAKGINGKLVHSNGEPSLVCKLKAKSVEADWNIEAMLEYTWYEYTGPEKEEKPAKDFSFTDSFKKLVAKIDKLLAEGGDPAYMDNLRMQRALAEQASKAIGL